MEIGIVCVTEEECKGKTNKVEVEKKCKEMKEFAMAAVSSSVANNVIAEILKLRTIETSHDLYEAIIEKYSPRNAAKLILLETEMEKLHLIHKREI